MDGNIKTAVGTAAITDESYTSAKDNKKNLPHNCNWLNNTVSFYPDGHSDTTPGKALKLRDILLYEFINYHPVLCKLKQLDYNDTDYKIVSKALKGKLAAYALNLLKGRKGNVLQHSGLLQLDFDYDQIKHFDIDSLMAAIFDLPFIAFCARSCSGLGFYAFARIAEPERLKEYAEHCFVVLDKLGIPVDTSKGRNYNDLRYVSYDANMMIKSDEKIKPLQPKKLLSKTKTISPPVSKPFINSSIDKRVEKAVIEISNATTGTRWETVRKWSYTLGGIPGASLDIIKDTIKNSSQFAGYEDHCIKCATDSYNAGRQNPLP